MEEEKKDKKPDVDYVKLIRSNEKKKSVIVILIFLIIMMAAVIALFYFGIVNMPSAKKCKDDTTTQTTCAECPKCEDNTKECNCPATTTNLGEKVSSVKEITLTEKNQTLKIGNKEVKVRRDSEYYLYVNNESATNSYGDRIITDHSTLYLTDKFLFVTQTGQFDESIYYAFGPKGEIVPNNNGNQMKNFKISGGYLHATGGVPYATEYDMNVDEHDLFIKYIDNTLIVVDAK